MFKTILPTLINCMKVKKTATNKTLRKKKYISAKPINHLHKCDSGTHSCDLNHNLRESAPWQVCQQQRGKRGGRKNVLKQVKRITLESPGGCRSSWEYGTLQPLQE